MRDFAGGESSLAAWLDPYPVLQATTITHRNDAAHPAVVVGIPPMEDLYIGGAAEKVFGNGSDNSSARRQPVGVNMRRRHSATSRSKARRWAVRLTARVEQVLAAHPEADRDNVRPQNLTREAVEANVEKLLNKSK